MRKWERKDYVVMERPFDTEVNIFDVIKEQGGKEMVIATIAPATVWDMEEIAKALNEGEDVNGWEDGMGRIIDVNRGNRVLQGNLVKKEGTRFYKSG